MATATATVTERTYAASFLEDLSDQVRTHGLSPSVGLAKRLFEISRDLDPETEELLRLRFQYNRASKEAALWKRGCEDRQRAINQQARTIAALSEALEACCDVLIAEAK